MAVAVVAVLVVVVVVAVVVVVVAVWRSRALGGYLGSGEPGASLYYITIL